MGIEDFYRVAAPFFEADYFSHGRTDDIEFYSRVAAESGGPVLEMGCGTGRILLPTARAGIEIHGLDSSPEMLNELRRKLAQEPAPVQRRVQLTLGDIRSAHTGRKFQLITAPFRVVQHLLEREDQRAWLRNLSAQLAPGASLCFDVFQPDYTRVAVQGEPVMEIDRVDPATGARVRRIAETVTHPERQLIEVTVQWVMEQGGQQESRKSTFPMRWFTRAELENLLELEAFEITDYWGSFAREPYGPGSREQIVRARRSGERRGL